MLSLPASRQPDATGSCGLGSIRHASHIWDSPYEAAFLTQVLVHVPGLDPTKTHVQHETQIGGSRRRIDFAVVDLNLRVAIEVDGYAKDPGGSHVTPEAFDAWTSRQTELTSTGWRVVRFTNRQTVHDPAVCIRQLELTLREAYGSDRASRAESLSRRELDELRRLQEKNAADLQQLRAEVTRQDVSAATTTAPFTTQQSGGGSGWQLLAWAGAFVLAVAVAWVAVDAFFPMQDQNASGTYSAPAPREPRTLADEPDGPPESESGTTPSGESCPSASPIKGNLSSSGDRIYHEPGWRYYDATVPERCFTSTSEAEAAGFRASKVH